jgi:hypothetical protein
MSIRPKRRRQRQVLPRDDRAQIRYRWPRVNWSDAAGGAVDQAVAVAVTGFAVAAVGQ